MTNSHKNIINPFLESSTLLIMTFPEIVESKDLLWGRTCAVDNVRARRKGVLGKLYEIQISPQRGLRNSLNFPSYFGMEYVRPWNMGKKLLESCFDFNPHIMYLPLWGTLQELAEPNLNPHPSSQEASNRVTTANLTCRIWPTDMKSLRRFYGFHSHGGTLTAGWFIMENPKITWVI